MSILRRGAWFAVGFAAPALAIGIGLATAAEEASSNAALPDLPVQSAESREVIADALSAAPSSQSSALADGNVSYEEYTAAARDNVACIRSRLDEFAASNYPRGAVEVVVEGPRASDDRFQLSYSYGIRSLDGTNVGEIDDVVPSIDARCQDRYLHATETVYKARLLADDDYVSETDRRLERCLSRSGVRASGNGTAREALAETLAAEAARPPDAVVECVGRFPSMTGTLEDG